MKMEKLTKNVKTENENGKIRTKKEKEKDS